MTHKPNEYQHIRAWGKYLGSYEYYIRGEQEKAAEEDAPLNAIHTDHDTGRWVTFDEVKNEDAILWLNRYIKEEIKK